MMSSKPWDERYSRAEYYYGIDPNTFLSERVSNFPKGACLLCLAEGEGRNAVYLAKLGYKVTAVDFSQVAIEKLKALAEREKVQIEVQIADLSEYIPAPNSWDGIISIWCHLPRSIRQNLHAKCVAALKPGGVFLLEAYTPEQLAYKTGGPQDPDLMPQLAQLQSELKELKVIFGREVVREIHEGVGHQGLSAVVQFIAQKE